MLVVDSSAALGALTDRPVSVQLMERLAEDGDLHAPHLIDIEVLSALRRLVRRGNLGEDRATEARLDWTNFPITRYPHVGLAERIWELRHNLTAYDAAFVALAEVLGAPLITRDRSLAESPGHAAAVELF